MNIESKKKKKLVPIQDVPAGELIRHNMDYYITAKGRGVVFDLEEYRTYQILGETEVEWLEGATIIFDERNSSSFLQEQNPNLVSVLSKPC